MTDHYDLPFQYRTASTMQDLQSSLEWADVVIQGRIGSKWYSQGLTTAINDLITAQDGINNFSQQLQPDKREHYLSQQWKNVKAIEAMIEPSLAKGLKVVHHWPGPLEKSLRFDLSTAEVHANTNVYYLNKIAKSHGICFPPSKAAKDYNFSIQPLTAKFSEMIYRNLPTAFDKQLGPIRDRVTSIEATLMTKEQIRVSDEDGWVYKGIDIRDVVFGTLGSMMVIERVGVKMVPLDSEPEVQTIQPGGKLDWLRRVPVYQWIQKVSLEDLSEAVRLAAPYVREFDEATGTLWGVAYSDVKLPRYEGDTLLLLQQGGSSFEFKDKAVVDSLRAAKRLLDPGNKLNPGVLPIL